MGAAPVAEGLQRGDEFFAGGVERVGDLGRDRSGCATQQQDRLFRADEIAR